ncbi:Ig-like domain-containing protein [Provencibacterium massiliense]|uniref:Ig-like domain-containing protein n=1 Tax=Provencibacterium massiliense TaxID=1841868 RepID=UPI0009A788D9|nr:Ig-like domain-containing protein [Provencibacterium massiliense]
MRRLPAWLLAVSLAAGIIPVAGAAAASADPGATLGGSTPPGIAEIDPEIPTPEISLFRARAAAGPEFIRVPVKNGDPARIEGFAVTALPEGGGEADMLSASGEPEVSGEDYSYKLYFSDPPQRDTGFTISVTPVAKAGRAGFDLPKTKTSSYTYQAIQSLTIKAGGEAVGDKTVYLQTGGERQTVQLAADKNPTSQSYAAEVLWSSSDPAIASVDPVTGMVTGNTGGTVTITAAVYDNPNTVTASCAVTVVPISGIGLNPSSKTLFTGGTAAETDFELAATLSGDNGGTELVWENSSPDQVNMTKVSNNVYHLSANGKQPGSATITVTDKGGFYKATCTVTVVQVTGLAVSPGSFTIYTQGAPQTVQLAATVTVSAGAAPAAAWTSNNPGIASVNAAGLVSAVAPGNATITASVGGKSGSSTITVKDKIPVTSVTVSGTNSLTRTGDNLNPTTQLAATVKPDNAHFKAVSWAKTGGPEGITIDASGLVTATTAGAATFTATADGVTSVPYTVTVTDQGPTGITISVSQMNLAFGGTGSVSATVSPATALNRNVTWLSSDTSIATVGSASTASGASVTITAGGKQGTATIYAKAAGNTGYSQALTVNVCKLGTTVDWAGRNWWVIDSNGNSYGGNSGSVVLLANFNYSTGIFGGNNTYSSSTVRSQCNSFYNSLNATQRGKLSKHKYVGDYAWLPSAYEIYGNSLPSWVADGYTNTKQFSYLTGVTTSNYGSVKIVYGGLNAWLRSRHSGGSVPACAVEINGGLVNYDASLSCSVRPAIILNP